MDDSLSVTSGSILQSDLPLEAKLERARIELLDLSANNRLLNVPRSSKAARIVEIVDESSTEVHRLLVREAKTFTFLPGNGTKEEAPEAEPVGSEGNVLALAQPADDEVDARGVQARHADTRLQTRLTSEGLQKRLLEMHYDARTLEEEQGVNILYLALGTLKWIDPNNAKNIRYAPLLLVPVSLDRGTAAERFRLRWRNEDISTNLSLELLLDRVHGITLPTPDLGDDLDVVAYAAEVAASVATKPGWEVLPDDIVLGFFSFAKFLMYRDLDPDSWPKDGRFVDKPLIRGLLSDGFTAVDDVLPDDGKVDAHIPPADMLHIVDCDSSQMVAIHEVRRGRDLVIQGPPGTGKSQTIANIVASAVADGKTVLFVAEKMAALDVVKRRLDGAGVGDACLELHSNKANKRQLLDELRRTWELGAPQGEELGSLVSRLTDARDRLNEHPDRLHRASPVNGRTPYATLGQLVRLRQDGHIPGDVSLPEAVTWTPDDVRRRDAILRELAARVDVIGLPGEHPWRHVGLEAVLPTEVERLKPRLGFLIDDLGRRTDDTRDLAADLELKPAETLSVLVRANETAERLAEAPDLESDAFRSAVWDEQAETIDRLVGVGRLHFRLLGDLGTRVRDAAWQTDVASARAVLSELPADTSPEILAAVAELDALLPRIAAEAAALRARLGIDGKAGSLADIERLAKLGLRVAAAPDASPEAFTASVWDRGVEQAADLVETLARLKAAREEIGDRLSDAAWTSDLAGARQTLASKGTSLTRFLSGEWRAANRLVASILKNPSASLPEILSLLDTLARAKMTATEIARDDAFGRSAFGPDWRGDRSDPGPLLALVDWMRTLRGLGAEPRLIASRVPVRSELADRSEALAKTLAKVRTLQTTARDALAVGMVTVEDEMVEDIGHRASRIRVAYATVGAVLTNVPDALSTALDLLRTIEVVQGTREALVDGGDVARAAFGSAWRDAASDWDGLADATAWVKRNGALRHIAARISDRVALAERARIALGAGRAFESRLAEMFSDLAVASPGPFETSDLFRVPLAAISGRLSLWVDRAEALSKWVAYRERANRARELGLEPLVERIEDGRLASRDVIPTFELACYEALYRAQVRAEPALARFDGELHSGLAAEFASLDRQRIAAASLQVARAHHARIPKGSGGLGPLGVLRAEMARRRGHMPIRQLVQRAGSAIQALKPVMMMSPLSVAQFLPPGAIEFDLLVMDEASQIQPVDAFGSVARCKQVVVVGDERQLPPTRFFSKMTGGASEDEEDSAQVSDIESILGLFTARGLPQRMLRWHYRSRHQSLIAVSNSQFYENRLYIVPSPFTAEAGMGLRFHHLPDGVFDSGNTGTNPIEARAVAEAIIRHAKSEARLSLGVATFSVRQRRAILDELEGLRRLNPDTEEFFHAHPSEPFFVKNLENVQGDERDVIIISVGYGRNAQGHMAMRFGPLGADGGERRLNVLISRAKRRCEVYASITDEDIDLERGKGKGIFAFKLFLHFARTGRLSMAKATGRDHDSVFEEQVARALDERGYRVHPQVGIAGFFIDLAISDPARPGRYLLGIECDGAPYHEARSARERDRLRQAVLEDHGWILHRIWSTDWFQRPKEQLDRVIAAIEAAKAELDEREIAGAQYTRAAPVQIVTVNRADVTEIGLVEAQADDGPNLYVEHVPERVRQALAVELHETPTSILADMVATVVEVEGPVHVDEVTARIRSAWGLQRSGARIQASVEQAVTAAIGRGLITRDGDFLSIPFREPVVRDRSLTGSGNLRKIEMLPPSEIRAAALAIARDHLGATREELVGAAARALGVRAVSAQIREVISQQIDRLLAEGGLTTQGSLLMVPSAAQEGPMPVQPDIAAVETV